jgi:hypothetical protein
MASSSLFYVSFLSIRAIFIFITLNSVIGSKVKGSEVQGSRVQRFRVIWRTEV